jgi:tetratricopeptide (TPR) repeat protein
MDAKFIAIIQKVISDRGKSIVNNHAVFNSLLADYARGEFMRERRFLIRKLKTTSFDDIMRRYVGQSQPAKSQPAPLPVPAENNVHCTKCGFLLPEDVTFCSKCGAKVSGGNNEDSSMIDLSVQCGGRLTTNLCCDCIYFQWVDEKKGEMSCTRYNLEGVLILTEEFEERDRRIKKGFKCLEAENNEKAARHFLKALSISPNGDAYAGLAFCTSRAGDYDEAIDLLNEAKEAYENEGDRKGVKSCNKMISEIQHAIKQKSENREELFNLGVDIVSKLLS